MIIRYSSGSSLCCVKSNIKCLLREHTIFQVHTNAVISIMLIFFIFFVIFIAKKKTLCVRRRRQNCGRYTLSISPPPPENNNASGRQVDIWLKIENFNYERLIRVKFGFVHFSLIKTTHVQRCKCAAKSIECTLRVN